MQLKEWSSSIDGRTKELIILAEFVAVMFGVFGGFLIKIIPVELGIISFGTGFAALVAILILLGIKLISKFVTPKNLKIKILMILFCISTVCFFYAGMQYWDTLNRWSFRYPDETGDLFLAGNELTELAKKEIKRDETLMKDNYLKLVFRFAVDPRKNEHKVWTKSGLSDIRSDLLWKYVFAVSVLALALGSGIEALYIGKKS